VAVRAVPQAVSVQDAAVPVADKLSLWLEELDRWLCDLFHILVGCSCSYHSEVFLWLGEQLYMWFDGAVPGGATLSVVCAAVSEAGAAVSEADSADSVAGEPLLWLVQLFL
jgi:hypothetical protein